MSAGFCHHCLFWISVPNKRLYVPCRSWLFLLSRLFKALIKEAIMVPACHRKNVTSQHHNGKRVQKQRRPQFWSISTCDVWHPSDTVWETGPASSQHPTIEEWPGWEHLLLPQIHLWHWPPCPQPLRQCLFPIPCVPHLVHRSPLLDE